MRIATHVRWLAAVTAAGSALAATLIVISMLREHAALSANLRLTTRLQPMPALPSHLPLPATAPSLELPPWFGDVTAPPARISGHVDGAAYPTLVRIALAGPDTGAWVGRTQVVGPDGNFDLGAVRRGRYLIIATSVGRSSRVGALDTIATPDQSIALAVAPCTVFHDELWLAERDLTPSLHPAVGIGVSIAGHRVTETDAAGHYAICAADANDVEVRDVAYLRNRRALATRRGPALWPAVPRRFVGAVFDRDGRRAVDVGIQPLWRGERCIAGDTVVTSDAQGSFALIGAGTLCGVRIWQGTHSDEARYVPFDHRPRIPGRLSLVLEPARFDDDQAMTVYLGDPPPPPPRCLSAAHPDIACP